MKIGICTRYYDHEATEAARAIAAWGERAGHDMTILATRKRPRWAESAVPCVTAAEQLFSEWAATCDAIIWTHIPHVEQTLWTREQGKHALLFALWSEWFPGEEEIMRPASALLCPTQAAATMARRLKLPAVFTGFQSFMPPVQRGPDPPGSRILFAMHGRWLYRTEMTALDALARALERCPQATATVLYNAGTLAGYARRRLLFFCKRLGGRLQLRRAVGPTAFADLLLSHDLLYWPTHMENTCYLGLLAGLLGVLPVVFDLPPVSEMFSDANAVLIPTRVGRNHAGVPLADPNYHRVADVIISAVEDRVGLLRRRREGLRIAKDRRMLFEQSLNDLFTGPCQADSVRGGS